MKSHLKVIFLGGVGGGVERRRIVWNSGRKECGHLSLELLDCFHLDRDLLFYSRIWNTISRSRNMVFHPSALSPFAFQLFYA